MQIVKSFNLGTYNAKSLHKLQVFLWGNENLLFLLRRANDYTGNTEKNPTWFIGSVSIKQK